MPADTTTRGERITFINPLSVRLTDRLYSSEESISLPDDYGFGFTNAVFQPYPHPYNAAARLTNQSCMRGDMALQSTADETNALSADSSRCAAYTSATDSRG